MEEELYKVNMIVHELSCLVPEQVISHQPLNPQLFFSSVFSPTLFASHPIQYRDTSTHTHTHRQTEREREKKMNYKSTTTIITQQHDDNHIGHSRFLIMPQYQPGSSLATSKTFGSLKRGWRSFSIRYMSLATLLGVHQAEQRRK